MTSADRCSPEQLREAQQRHGLATQRLRGAVTASLDIAVAETQALAHLALDQPLTPGDLARRLDLSSGGATGLTQRLFRRGYLARAPSPHDARSILLSPTEAAIRELAVRRAQLVVRLERLAQGLTGDERRAVHDFMSSASQLADQAVDAPLRPSSRQPRRAQVTDPRPVVLAMLTRPHHANASCCRRSREAGAHFATVIDSVHQPVREAPMKAIGTGAPELITLQLDDVEVELYRDALSTRRLAIANAIVEHDHQDSEHWRNRELVACARLTQQLENAGIGARIAGPTDLILRLARDAARESGHRLLAAIEEHRHHELTSAAAAAHACADTLAAAHHADAHGLADGHAIAM